MRVFFVLGLMLVLASAASLRVARAGWGDDPAPAPQAPTQPAAPAKPGTAPKYDFQLDDLHASSDVQMQELNDMPLVVHVWAPDCPMCKRNMPYFKGVTSKLDPKQVKVVACSMGAKNETSDYVKEHELKFPVLVKGHSQDFISKGFTDDGWPTTFVFAPGGELVGTCDSQGAEYEKKTMELIDKAIKIADAQKPKDPPKKVKHWY